MYDQWVVHDRFDPYRPFFRVDLDDEDRTHLYVSTKTTEVHQKTNRQQRLWNYFGAVIHWIYPVIKGLGSLGPIGLVGLLLVF